MEKAVGVQYSQKAPNNNLQLSSHLFHRYRGRWFCGCWVSATYALSWWDTVLPDAEGRDTSVHCFTWDVSIVAAS